VRVPVQVEHAHGHLHSHLIQNEHAHPHPIENGHGHSHGFDRFQLDREASLTAITIGGKSGNPAVIRGSVSPQSLILYSSAL
jgi:hypothetical protein